MEIKTTLKLFLIKMLVKKLIPSKFKYRKTNSTNQLEYSTKTTINFFFIYLHKLTCRRENVTNISNALPRKVRS